MSAKILTQKGKGYYRLCIQRRTRSVRGARLVKIAREPVPKTKSTVIIDLGFYCLQR